MTAEPVWPSLDEVHAASRERLDEVLRSCGGLTEQIAREAMSSGRGVLSEKPRSLTSFLVPAACVCGGRRWRTAVWPAVAAECMMAAADVLDDAADADPADETQHDAAVLLTAGAGLLSLAFAALVHVVEDGASQATATALVRLLGEGFAEAANGQARNLQPTAREQVDALTAYREAASKSGPLGSLIARLGARTATDDADIVTQLGDFGRRLAVRSQLLNDARDAAPEPAHLKSDVRAGARTVPLAFVGSRGAPAGLTAAELAEWEQQERTRVAAGGGLIAAHALAEAERLGALQALVTLERLGCPVQGLRELVES